MNVFVLQKFKIGGEIFVKTNLGEKIRLVPFFLVYYF